jgi:hypothetical protein
MNETSSNSSTLAKLAILTISLLPIVFYYLCAQTFAVNVPWLDDIDLFFQHFLNGSSFSERSISLISQHNDHRLLIPRLLSEIIFNISGKIDLVQLIAVGNLGLLLILIAEYSLLKSSRIPLFYIISVVYLLFSLTTWLNMTWATTSIQHNYAILFSILSIKYFISPYRYQILIGMLFAILLIFTSGAGLMIFPCLLAYLLTLIAERLFSSKISDTLTHANDQLVFKLFAFTICSAAALTLYYFNYQSPGNYHSIAENLASPGRVITYFFVFLGSYTREIGTAFTAGLLTFLIFIRLTWKCHHRKHPQLYFIALLIIFMALGATLTRSAFSIGQAMSSRYCITSITFLIFIYLSVVASLTSKQQNKSLTKILALLLGFLIYGFTLHSLEGLQLRRATLEQGMKRWLTEGTGLHYPDSLRVRKTLTELMKKGLYSPPKFDETEHQNFRKEK